MIRAVDVASIDWSQSIVDVGRDDRLTINKDATRREKKHESALPQNHRKH